jgi:hypothetical protein
MFQFMKAIPVGYFCFLLKTRRCKKIKENGVRGNVGEKA